MMIEIEDIKKISLGPEDTLVIKVDGKPTAEMVAQLKREFAKGFGNVSLDRLVVIDRSVSLQVLTAVAGGPTPGHPESSEFSA